MRSKNFGAAVRADSPVNLRWRKSAYSAGVAFTTILACLALFGYLTGMSRLTSIYSNSPATSPVTAVAFLALASAASMTRAGMQRPILARAGSAVAIAVAILSAILLIPEWSQRIANLANVLVAQGNSADVDLAQLDSQMSPLASVGLILLAISIVLARPKTAVASQSLVFYSTVIALTISFGYITGSEWIYENQPGVARIAPLTAAMLVATGVAIISLTADSGFASVVFSPHLGGKLARRLLPIALTAPLFLGWLLVAGQEMNLYGTGFGLSIMVGALIFTLSITVIAGCRWLDRSDRHRDKAEAIALERASRISDLMEAAAEGIILLDQHHRIIMANPSARHIFARGELVGEEIDPMIPDGLKALDQLERSQSVSGVRKNLRMVGETRSGRLFPIEGSIAKHVIAGETTYTFIFRDISDRVRAENRIRTLNQRLEDQVKRRTEQLNRAVGDLEAFSYSVSHDLRAPIRAMSGFAQIIIEDHGHELSRDILSYLERIKANASFMSELIDGLLEFSRIEQLPTARQRVDMREMFKDEMEAVLPDLSDRRIELTLDELPDCKADPVLIRRVIANLLSNAIKFTQKSDPAIIDVGYDRSINAYFVRDNGVGFDSTHSDEIFQVFQRLHPRDEYAGTGVGLALSRRIIERHGGRIWADARPGAGATFYFSFDTILDREPERLSS